jgi:DNA polymerase-4
MLWVPPGCEAAFLAPLQVRRIPGVGAKTEEKLATYGIHRVGDMARLDEKFVESLLGKWGLALVGKAHGLDAGGYFKGEVGDHDDPKSISHEHTFNDDSADADLLESTLAKLSQMVARRLREHQMHARTVQVKLRYSDFTTLTRANTLEQPTQIDIELIEHSRLLFRKNWNGSPVRLLGVQTSSLEHAEGQLNLLEGEKTRRWRSALSAMDKLRDRFGEKSVSVASGLKGMYEERVHENPAGLPGKDPKST